jgi:hypothetical protein
VDSHKIPFTFKVVTALFSVFTFRVGIAHAVEFSLCQQWGEEGDIIVDNHKILFTFKVGTGLFSHSGYRYPTPGRIFPVPAVERRGGHHRGQSQDSLHIQGRYCTLFTFRVGTAQPVKFSLCQQWGKRDIIVDSHKIPFAFKVGAVLFHKGAG